MALLTCVLGPLVGQQGPGGDEALAAFAAAEGPLAGVDPLVGPPGVVVGEGLLAVGALVELLLGVAEAVHLQVVGDGEALAAVVTGEGLLARVEEPDVGAQVGGLGEPLAAGGAEEGPLTRVGHHVRFEMRRLREPLSALGTLVGLEASVGAVVQLQALQAGETLSALVAVILLQVLMRPLMAAKAAQQLEAFPTGVADVGLPVGVGGLVNLQALGVAERLGAVAAWKQFGALVRLAVEVETLVRHKHLTAGGAAVALFPLMLLEVHCKVLLEVKAVPTKPALEGFSPRVRAVVGLPVPLQGEGPVTVGAAVRLAALVDLLVDHQTNQGGVGLPAVPTLIGLLSLVDVQMSL